MGKICQFLNKNGKLKNINSFLSKEFSPKKVPVSRHNEQHNTLTRQEYKSKINVKNIRKKSCRI